MNNRLRKIIIISGLFILFLDFLTVGTVSYFKRLETKSNSFILGTVDPKVVETFDSNNNIRENIYIHNDGNFSIYVRAIPIYYFKNNNKELIDSTPVVNVDYSINFSSSINWIKGSDGYYYYKKPIGPSEDTDNLVDKCLEINTNDENTFFLDVVVQAIQAFPSKAVEEAWNVNVVDNIIEIE